MANREQPIGKTMTIGKGSNRGKFTRRMPSCFACPLYLDKKIEQELTAAADKKGVELSEPSMSLLKKELSKRKD